MSDNEKPRFYCNNPIGGGMCHLSADHYGPCVPSAAPSPVQGENVSASPSNSTPEEKCARAWLESRIEVVDDPTDKGQRENLKCCRMVAIRETENVDIWHVPDGWTQRTAVTLEDANYERDCLLDIVSQWLAAYTTSLRTQLEQATKSWKAEELVWRQSDHEHRIKQQQMQAGAEALVEKLRTTEAQLEQAQQELHYKELGLKAMAELNNAGSALIRDLRKELEQAKKENEIAGYKELAASRSLLLEIETREKLRAQLKQMAEALEKAESLISKLVEALEAIRVALQEPAGGEYWTARKLADKWGIFNDDLEGERVLLRLAIAALKLAEARRKG